MLSNNRHIIYLLSLFLFIGCSKKAESPAGMLEKAKTEISESKFTDATQLLRRLVEQYPESPEAAEAQYMLGDTFISAAKDFEQAVNEYKLVVGNYPESRFAVNAQFMIGYVYANFLNEIEMARKEYTRFLDLYADKADSGLVQSVRFELENLGRDLNEIPKLRHITS